MEGSNNGFSRGRFLEGLASAANIQDLKLCFSAGGNEYETDGISVGMRTMRDYVGHKSGTTMKIGFSAIYLAVPYSD